MPTSPNFLSVLQKVHEVHKEPSNGLSLADPYVAAPLSLMVGLIPVLIGVFMISILKGWKPGRRLLLSGLATGILFASFFDLMKGTAGLSSSTLKNITDVLNVFAFSIAFVVFYLSHRILANGVRAIGVAYLWAVLGIGFHSVGEGIIIGYDFATGFTILSIAQTLSFTLHKLAEGITLGVLMYSSSKVRLVHPIIGGVVAGVPVAIGTLLGLVGLPEGTSTIFFAAASGATVYVIANLFQMGAERRAVFPLGMLIGFLYMYFAGVLHQFE
jgi:ZIP family zinc transporter